MAALTTSAQLQARAEGRRRLAALRRRAHRIRVWVGCVAVIVFMAMFATIYVQMSRGQDPALGTSTSTSAGTQTTAKAATVTQSSSSSSTQGSSSQVSSVTTQQS
ncbi:MAG: hypothetical protein QOG68_2403 [Solirubrobacteraceae bacterium]|jgi:hypothetical protein|nr:hypothetical protein [Solirubrobacteraceae bacterium]